jgi:hypothetical protein
MISLSAIGAISPDCFCRPATFLPSSEWRFAGLPVLAGRGMRDVAAANVPGDTLLFGMPLVFLWLVLEVGVVEEFFFRVLQSRLSAACGPSWAESSMAFSSACSRPGTLSSHQRNSRRIVRASFSLDGHWLFHRAHTLAGFFLGGRVCTSTLATGPRRRRPTPEHVASAPLSIP